MNRSAAFDPHLLPGLASLFITGFRDRQQLQRFRDRQLRLLVRHACRNVPYYRSLFDRAGIRPSCIRSEADLAAIPVSRKEDLLPLATDQVVAAGYPPEKQIQRRSSGTTGVPFTIRRTWLEERLLQAFRWRALLDSGLRPTDRIGAVARIRDIHPNDSQIILRTLNTLGLCRTSMIDCFLPFAEIIDQLERHRFPVITGLAGTLYQTALHSLHTGRGIPSPRLVVTGGETLLPHMRSVIEAAFGTRVCDTYGSHEFNLLAWQCRTTGEYHLCDDSLIIEILRGGRPAKPGEEGEVVVTSLFSRAMPFIRYHLGDTAIQGETGCACGAPFATIKEIKGRTIEFLVLPDGRLMHPFQIIRLIVHAPRQWVRQYQLVQESRESIVLRIVPLGNPPPGLRGEFERTVRAMPGMGGIFRTELTAAIPMEPSGKYAVFKTLLPNGQIRPNLR
ncbi:MAG: phenylacetate--CoA ligase family protein [Desulfobulbaceae bacterium]|nr:MAG: phenylacetate--CoA ligase family protein [Desulfobulbaceae bacterium]